MKAVKLLHAKWVMEAFNHMTSSIEKDICLKGWNKSGIQEALENGFEDNLDPRISIQLRQLMKSGKICL